MKKLALGTLVGAAVAYLFDPRQGKRRRNVAVDWSAGRIRRAGRKVEQARQDYAKFVKAWARADADLPETLKAKEMATVGGASSGNK